MIYVKRFVLLLLIVAFVAAPSFAEKKSKISKKKSRSEITKKSSVRKVNVVKKERTKSSGSRSTIKKRK